jgi:serine/threonine protein kinase
MDKPLVAGMLLGGRFRIAGLFGQGQASAAHLAADLDEDGAWTLVWESPEMFRMRHKPRGVLQYLTQDERHYLVLRLEGLDLGLIYNAAEVVEEQWATLWMAQICDGIGQWHTRGEVPVVCLRLGDIRLGDLRLTSTGRAMLPSCDLLTQPVEAVVAAQTLAFSAPEKALEQRLTVRSDVYALGAALYCLVTGTPPPDPRSLVDGQAELVRPRKVRRKLSGRLEKMILKAMSLNADQRYESAMQLGFELDRCVPGHLRRSQFGAF